MLGDATTPQHRTDGSGERRRDLVEDRGRRWYQLRPDPRRRADLMGFNSTLWMVVVWIVVIALVAFPYPWWW